MKKPIKTITLVVKLDILKGSVNRMLIIKKDSNRMIYSGNYRQQKQKVQKYLEENWGNVKDSLKEHPEFYYTIVEYVVYDHWLTKTSNYRKLRKKDVANYTKNAEDMIFSFLGAEDETIISSVVEKGLIGAQDSPQLHCTISLYEMDPSVFKRLEEPQ